MLYLYGITPIPNDKKRHPLPHIHIISHIFLVHPSDFSANI
jgi:hypothetical protein